MRSAFRAIALAIVVLLVAALPAGARNTQDVRLSYEGFTVGFNPDPGAVADRCGEGFGWILQVAGTGEMRSPHYTGPVDFFGEHCSQWVAFNPPRGVGVIGGGVQIWTTPSGDELVFSYQGGFKFEGDVDAGVWVSNVDNTYTVIDGTGVFEGLIGHGRMNVVDNSGYVVGHSAGSLYPG